MNPAFVLTLVLVAQPPLELPWTCGETIRVNQDHNGGTHTDEGRWAWDFDLDVGDEVWASAPGVVRNVKLDSDIGGCDHDLYSYGNYVVVDHGDGTAALYLHLQQWSSSLDVGDPVCAGDVIGRVGLTGWVCGEHLHFQLQELCNSWWCQSIEAEFLVVGDPLEGETPTSNNCETWCGCEAVLDGGETLVSESDTYCFKRVTEHWWDVAEGHDGHHYYTYAMDTPVEDTYGEWHFGVSTPGTYRVEAYIPDTEADSHQATYQVHHADGVNPATVNQSVDKGWQELGTFRFDDSSDPFVHLGDNTGEDYETYGRKLAFDALRFVYIPPGDDDTGDDDDDATGDDDTTAGDDDDTGDDDTGPGGDPPGPPERTGGCACRVGASPAPAWFAILALIWIGLRRRDPRGR